MQSPALESTLVPELGKYHLVAELARGGMGIVHLAAAQGPGGFNKLLVVKELRPELSHDEAYVSMFLDEARLAARLAHPNIVQTMEVGSEGSRHYMVMEFLDGRSLHRMIRRFKDKGGFPVAAHLRILAEALVGLQYAHDLRDFDGESLGIVHRDVSPLNVFVTFDGQAKVVDFGIAKSIESSTETKTGVLKGRVAYMAPEQAWGHAVDRRADVYAAGVMLWEAAAGRRLWPGMTDVEILARLLREGPPPLSAARPDAPEDLEAICARAMERRPEDRYESAVDLLDDLEAHLASRDDRMGMREVGALVGRVFAEERRRMNSLIEETLARVRGGPRSGVMPTLEVHVRGTPSGAAGLRTEDASQISGQLVLTPLFNPPAPSISVGPATSTPAPSTASGLGDAPPWWASRRAAVVASSGAVVLLMVVVVLLTGFRDDPPARAPDAPVAVAAPAPPGRDMPDLVDVVVRVSPASAQITIDGMPAPTNPFHARYGKDAQVHRVLASAEGYEAKLEEVFFANDVSIDVSLDRRASPPPPRYYPPIPAAHGSKRGGAAAGATPAASETSTGAPSPPPRVDIAPTGGRAPLRPIVTSNPYGTP